MVTDPDTPKLITVAEGFCVRQEVDNIAWIDLGGCAVVVDALEHAELEGEVLGLIARTLGDAPVRYVLNTHTHYDHTALNEAFRRRGAEIVNQGTASIPPDGRWFEGTKRKVLMLPLPGCHTDEDCVVRVEPEGALFTGDIFGWGLIPSGGLDDAMADRLLETYRRMIDFGAETVVPGHGPLCATAELKRWVEYFRWLRRQVGAAIAAGKGDREIRKQLPPPDDMRHWWRFLDWKHEDSLGKVLGAVRSGALSAG